MLKDGLTRTCFPGSWSGADCGLSVFAAFHRRRGRIACPQPGAWCLVVVISVGGLFLIAYFFLLYSIEFHGLLERGEAPRVVFGYL